MISPTLLGYTVGEEIFRSQRTIVHRAQHVDGGRAVLKMLRDPRPSRQRVAWFRREYELLQRLGDVEGVVRALGFGYESERWVLCLEDIGGTSLTDLLRERPLPLDEALRVGQWLAATLDGVQRRQVMHKDINPSNVVLNRGTGQMRLIDFGIATERLRERGSFETPTTHEGTLAYMSPEQTGRVNREVDHRTDLYSLGATLYHVLVGAAPFESNDPMELVHAHIARIPRTPTEVAPELPEAVSTIVMRLLAKSADERYQSAAAVRDDLAECARQLRETGSIATFPLARNDRSPRFTLPRRIYGREREVEVLLGAFERAATGEAEVVLVEGYSGVGKSTVVHELYAPITARRGAFISGKFDQLQRDVPLSAVADAFRALLRQMLGEAEDRVAQWKRRILRAVGSNARVLTTLLPELEHLLGPQPEVPALPPSEAETRFDYVFARFVETLARPQHPIALFLDDLQWADAGSLRVIESLLRRRKLRHLLVLGACRDNEVGAGHPLRLMLDRVASEGTPRSTLTLRPLEIDDLSALVADTLACDPSEARALAGVIAAKTHGNPYFTRLFLESLHDDGLLVQGDRWTWDLAAITARGVTDNVVDLMASRLRALPAATVDALGIAAALGNEFELATLSVATGTEATSLWSALIPALNSGVLLPLGDSYKLVGVEVEGFTDDLDALEVRCRFAHDRVQQAAWQLVAEAERASLHHTIGRRMLAAWDGPALEARLFDVVGHLLRGSAYAETDVERAQLATLALRASVKAKASAAFAIARAHSTEALDLLGPGRFADHYDLAMALCSIVVETSYQTGDFEGMQRWFDEGVRHARSPIDTAWMQEILTESLNARGRPLDALTHALDYLDALGVRCPRAPTMEDVGREMGDAVAVRNGRTPAELGAAPDMVDPAIRTAVELICKIYSSAYVASPLVFVIVALTQFQLVARHGNCPVSPLVYAVYGLLQAGLVGDISAGYAFGYESSLMLDRPEVQRFKAQALHLFSCHTRFWCEHLKASADGEREAYRVGLDTGEMEFGCYGGHVATKYALFHGHELRALLAEAEQYTDAMRRFHVDIAHHSHLPWHQTLVNLTSPCAEPWALAGTVYDAEAARAALEATNDRMALSNTNLARLMLACVFERFDDAVALADAGTPLLDSVLSQFNQPLHLFFDALARVEVCAQSPDVERPALLARVDAGIEHLKKWSAVSGVNLAQKVALLEAGRLRVEGNTAEARDRYDLAIDLARANAFVTDEALACEAAHRFCVANGRPSAARHYLQDAHDAYARWGAVTKVSTLEAAHPELRAIAPESALSITHSATGTTDRAARSALDFAAVMRAAQAISTEVVLAKLLRRLVTTVLEVAGAERAVLLLDHDGRLRVEAEAHAGDVDARLLESREPDEDSLPLSVLNYVTRTGESLVLDDAGTSQQFGSDPYVASRRPRSVLCQPVLGGGRLRGAIYLENNLASGVFSASRREVIGMLAGQMSVSIENARLYESLERRVRERTEQLESRNRFIREVFGRYMADEVVDTLLDAAGALKLGGELRTVTVMFTDIRGFTPTCEHLPPEKVVQMLNGYFSAMTRVIQKRQGTIGDIAGDGMMVVFGAPLWREDDASRAVACAIEMQLAMEEVNAANEATGLPPIAIGVGIHTGEVIVGNIGSVDRAKYSVVGRNVNLASRIETLTTGGQIYVSEQTLRAVGEPLRIDGEQQFAPKGVTRQVTAYLVGGIGGRFGVELPMKRWEVTSLQRPLPLSLSVVDEKTVRDERYPGELVAIGVEAVEIAVVAPLTRGANVVLDFEGRAGAPVRVYAKVVSGEAGRYTANLSSDRTKLDALLKAAQT